MVACSCNVLQAAPANGAKTYSSRIFLELWTSAHGCAATSAELLGRCARKALRLQVAEPSLCAMDAFAAARCVRPVGTPCHLSAPLRARAAGLRRTRRRAVPLVCAGGALGALGRCEVNSFPAQMSSYMVPPTKTLYLKVFC